MFFNFFSVYTVESIKAQSKKEVTSDNWAKLTLLFCSY
jgi:hypothetical protein